MPNRISFTMLEEPGISGTPRPELAGRKVRILGATPIYLVDPNGFRRLVPFPLAFMNLFEDKALQHVLVADQVTRIAEGPPLDNGAVLLRGRCSERIYLLDHGRKRLIAGQRMMEKYEFSEEAVVVVPGGVIEAIPEGEIWE